MSYGRDPDIMIRGVGAIASRDAGSRRRLFRRVQKAKATRARDARVRNLTYDQRQGMRGLAGGPITKGQGVHIAPQYGAGTMTPPPTITTTVPGPGVRPATFAPGPGIRQALFAPGPGRPGTVPGTPPTLDPLTIPTPTTTTPPTPTTTVDPNTGVPIIGGGGGGSSVMTMYVCADGTKVSDLSQCSPDPDPGAGGGMITPGGGGKGGGGKGGGGDMVMYLCNDGMTKVANLSQCPQIAITPPTPHPDLQPDSDHTLLKVAAGIGILWLLLRDDD